jgi:hypothetical protein
MSAEMDIFLCLIIKSLDALRIPARFENRKVVHQHTVERRKSSQTAQAEGLSSLADSLLGHDLKVNHGVVGRDRKLWSICTF